ncbi:hypothetical protein [Photobacterium satsumensis]|uniref:hypothetical protein n=1 Tax=Photobacterium satsumensis TaxID=2910239 RepID=UPI003D0A5528
MKRLLITIFALLSFITTSSSFAAELTEADIKRIENEVGSMADFMKLSPAEEKTITELKKELTLSNRDAVALYGRGSSEFKQARKKAMKSYQGELYQIITKKELQEWRQAKAGK